ncbi:hypothetical protein F5141DRAFT_1221729 [Pisolithus sp. B1]|nr:hypothetical protein F5141DRAFT_1221729 [Pisolithus sp. B1]
MPQGKADDVLRFLGHPDNLLQYLEEVQNLCMQASCFKDHEWAQWSIWYLGIDKFKRWRSLLYAERDWADFVTDASQLFLSFRCPAVWCSKHNLYDLIDEQKKVKIDLYEALLDYQLCFTKGLIESFKARFFEGLSGMIEGERLLKKGYHLELREACITRDQQRAQEVWYEARVQESKAMRAEEQCRTMEKSARLGLKASQSQSSTALEIQLLTHSLQDSSKLSKAPGESSRSEALEVDGQCKSSFDHIEVTSYIAEEQLTAELQRECLQGKLEEQSEGELLGAKASVELEATEASGNLPVPQSEYLHFSLSPYTNIPPQNPPIEPQDAQDKPRMDERPVKAVAHALEVSKPTLESRDDLCEVPEQVRHTEVEEIE